MPAGNESRPARLLVPCLAMPVWHQRIALRLTASEVTAYLQVAVPDGEVAWAGIICPIRDASMPVNQLNRQRQNVGFLLSLIIWIRDCVKHLFMPSIHDLPEQSQLLCVEVLGSCV